MERKQTALRTLIPKLNNVAFERSFNDGIDREVTPSADYVQLGKKQNGKWEKGFSDSNV
jgi:hypothetical protein